MNHIMTSFRNFISIEENANMEKEENLSLTFRYNNLIFIFEYFEGDPYFYRLALPGIFEINDSYSQWIYKKIDEYGFKFKVARLVKNNNEIWAIADTFVYSDDNINQLFKRTISCLISIYNELKEDYFAKKNELEK